MTKLCMFLSACLVCVLCAIVTAQECPTAATNDFLKCLEAAEKAKQESAKQQFEQVRQRHEEFKQKIDACFTSNNCQAPQKIPFGFGGPQKLGGGESKGNGNGIESAKNEADRNKTRACKEAIREKIEERIQACVQGATGLTLPHFGGPKSHFGGAGPHRFGGPGGPRGGWGGPGGRAGPAKGPGAGEEGDDHPDFPGFGHGGFGSGNLSPGNGGLENLKARAKEFVVKQCANSSDSSAADKVLQCLNDTFSVAKEEWNKTAQPKQAPAFFEQFCSAKNNCVAQLNNAGCDESQVSETVKKAIKVAFECARNETEKIKADQGDAAAGIDQCQGVNLTHAEKGPGGPKPAFGPGAGGNFLGKGKGRELSWHDPCDVFKGVPVHESSKPEGGSGARPPYPPGGPAGRQPPSGGPDRAADGRGSGRRPNF